MKFLEKVWLFSVKAGLSLFIFSTMFLGAVSLVSLTQKGKIYYGNRCKSVLNKKVIDYLNQEEIVSFDYELKCNTLYLDLTLNDSTEKERAKSILVRMSSYYESIEYNVDTQISLKGYNYLILASIVNKEVSLNITSL